MGLSLIHISVESDGYQAVQLGFGEVSAKKVNKAAAGHFKKANVAPKKTLREFRLEDVSATVSYTHLLNRRSSGMVTSLPSSYQLGTVMLFTPFWAM